MKKKQTQLESMLDQYQDVDEIIPVTANPAMASVPIGTVALVAATLARPDISALDCVVKAYEILELVVAGQAFLANPNDPHQPGIGEITVQYFLQDLALGPEFDPEEWIHVKYAIRDDQYNCLPIPLEDALKYIDPKPGGKPSARLPRFRQWLIDKDQISVKSANERIDFWKKEGMPWKEFVRAFRSFPKWRKASISKMKSIAGKAGQAAKAAHSAAAKVQQGKKRNQDARRGAKLPGNKSNLKKSA